MSKEALRAFIEDSLPHPDKCYTGIRAKHKGDDDTEFGMCLQSVGIRPGNTKDEKGRYRFTTKDPVDRMTAVFTEGKKWTEAIKFLAEEMIAFQIKIEHIYVLEYFMQYLKALS